MVVFRVDKVVEEVAAAVPVTVLDTLCHNILLNCESLIAAVTLSFSKGNLVVIFGVVEEVVVVLTRFFIVFLLDRVVNLVGNGLIVFGVVVLTGFVVVARARVIDFAVVVEGAKIAEGGVVNGFVLAPVVNFAVAVEMAKIAEGGDVKES